MDFHKLMDRFYFIYGIPNRSELANEASNPAV